MKPQLEEITKKLLWKIIDLDEDVKNDCNVVINDCLVEIWDMKKPTDYAIKVTFMSLPFNVILEALQHGFSDTPTRDSIYTSIKEQKETKQTQVNSIN